MDDVWFTEMADELARCLLDARSCADAAEALLESVRGSGDAEVQRVVLDALVAPVAVARVLMELLDHPPQLTLAAAHLLRDTSESAALRLTALGGRVDADEVIRALGAVVESSGRLLEVAA